MACPPQRQFSGCSGLPRCNSSCHTRT